MNPWTCAFTISAFGALGGIINALMTDNKFLIPKMKNGIICPGIISNVFLGAASAFASWALYGSGASIELAKQIASQRQDISLTFGALAGAFVVGIAGAKWLTNEVDKQLLRESVKDVAQKNVTSAQCDKIIQQSPKKILEDLERM